MNTDNLIETNDRVYVMINSEGDVISASFDKDEIDSDYEGFLDNEITWVHDELGFDEDEDLSESDLIDMYYVAGRDGDHCERFSLPASLVLNHKQDEEYQTPEGNYVMIDDILNELNSELNGDD